jgi:hypothetical protein
VCLRLLLLASSQMLITLQEEIGSRLSSSDASIYTLQNELQVLRSLVHSSQDKLTTHEEALDVSAVFTS